MIALLLAAAWVTAAPLPQARTEVAGAAVRGEIVLVGGLTADGAPSARVDAYSPAADRWRRLPDLPAGVHHALAASDGRRLYVVGGYGNPLGGGGPTRAAYVSDNRAWHALPRHPEPRPAGGASSPRQALRPWRPSPGRSCPYSLRPGPRYPPLAADAGPDAP